MYLLRTPDARLRPHIEHYWFVLDAAGEPVKLSVDVFVDARADLIVNAGAPYRRHVVGGSTTRVATSNLDAQRLVPIRIEQEGRVRVLGVRFLLGGLGSFTGVRLSEISGCTPAPSDVFGPEAGPLEERLNEERDPDAAAGLLDEFFLHLLARHGPHPGFRRALHALESGQAQTVADMAARAQTSVRHLERLFAHELGFSPRTVGRVVRFQTALRALMRSPTQPLGEIASLAGYFDQAHFVREFRRFTGGVPRGYRGYYPPEGPDDFQPNVVAYVQDAAGPASGH